ncbi:MAG: zinc-binding dehydrogenase [Armatimonadota bacterium]
MPRAAVIPSPSQPVEIRTYAEPEPAPGEAVLETIASEVCGTDVHLWHGRLPGVPYPLVPGHVSVGVVRRSNGPLADIDGNPIAPGTVATFLDVHGTCHRCRTCLVDRAPTKCPSRRVYGITLGADDGLHGGWSERIVLRPGTLILPLPASVPAERWIAAGCGLPTALHAIDLAGIRLGDRVLVLGAGPVGLAATALALQNGAGWVGVVDPVEARRDAARNMGADAVFDLDDVAGGAVRRSCGGNGPDIVVEAAGNPDAVKLALRAVRPAGRVVVVGQYTDNGETTIHPHNDINRPHATILGCWGVEFHHFQRAVDVLARTGDRFPWEKAIGRRYALEEAGTALRDVEARRVVKALIVP